MKRTWIPVIFAAVAIRTSTPLDDKRHVLENTNLVIEGRPVTTLSTPPKPPQRQDRTRSQQPGSGLRNSSGEVDLVIDQIGVR